MDMFKFDLQMFATDIVVGTEYQLKWGEESTGIFAVTVTADPTDEDKVIVSSVNVAAQSSATTLAAPDDGETAYYLVAENSVDDSGVNTIVWSLQKVTTDGDDTTISPIADANITSGAVNLTAGDNEPLDIQVEEAPITFTITNLAGGSTIKLKEGDTATTGSLAKDATITVDMGDDDITYTAAAANTTLKFAGEVIEDNNVNPLVSGNVKVTASITLPKGYSVETDDADGVVVNVANGKVTSITGLNGTGKTVTVNEGQTTILYTALDDDGTMVSRKETVTDGDDVTVTTKYLDLTKAGGEIYSNKSSYQSAVYYTEGDIGNVKDTAKYLYVATLTSAAAALEQGVSARKVNDEEGTFLANAGAYYIKVNSSTKAASSSTPKTTTISSIELFKSNAAGKLTKVTNETYSGQVAWDADGNAVVLSKKASDKYTVNITNADIRSKFTNLGTSDAVVTAAGTTELSAGTYTVYNSTVSNTITIKGKVAVTVAGGAVTNLTGLDGGESVTITGISDDVAIREITATKTKDGAKITVKDTDNEGNVSTYKDVAVSADDLAEANIAGDISSLLGDTEPTSSIVADFDWTLNKSHVGYFAASTTATIPKTGKTSITSAKAANYIKVELNEDGTEATLSAVKMNNAGEYTPTDPSEAFTFKGALNITAPDKAITIKLDSTDNFDTEKATAKITNLANNSVVDASVFAGTKSATVTTAKLSSGDNVTVNGAVYHASGNNAALTINDGGLYSGTVWAGTTGATDAVTVGKYVISDGKTYDEPYDDITEESFTVTANSGSTFTLGALDDGDMVTVVDNTDTAPLSGTYTKYGSYLYNSDTSKMYSLGTQKTIASSALDTSKTAWKTAYDTSTNTKVTSTVKLALADKSIAAGDEEISFVRDKYMTSQPEKATNVAATVIATEAINEDYTIAQGAVADATYGLAHKYTAVTAQTIEVTNGWEVEAAAASDTTIKGAASGKDYLKANTGNDTITLSGAEDIVDESTLGGEDTISGYASGKDKLIVAAGSVFTLSAETANDVYVAAAEWTSETSNYALLKGVGGKAVSISDDNGGTYVDYYFGNGKSSTNSFTYVDGAYYVGNGADGATNTLKVATDKTKRSKTNEDGAVVSIDLQTNEAQYQNINVLDAAASANEVSLTANDAGSTLKGGTYKSTLTSGAGNDTLVGGSGQDTFAVGAITGKDTIKSYTSDKDVVTTSEALTAAKFSADAKGNVILTKDDNNTVTIEGAVNKAITVNDNNVYVGKAATKNTFTVTSALDADDIYVGSTAEDTIKLTRSISELAIAESEDGDGNVVLTAAKYQGGTINLSGTNCSSIDVFDASGVKVASSVVSEYGTKYVKAIAGVDVTASGNGTKFTGSAFNDKFTCGAGNDYVIYTKGQGEDTIANFGAGTVDDTIGDVIQFNGLNAKDVASIAEQFNSTDYNGTVSLNNGAVKLHIAKEAGVTATASGTTLSAKVTTI